MKTPNLKKVAFSVASVPMFYTTWSAYKWQLDRKEWKKALIAERTQKLSQPTEEISVEKIPHPAVDPKYFDEHWLNKPLSIRGVFDHSKETFVVRTRDGDRGYEVITPLYTKVDSSGKLHGIFVNRGRIPMEYRELGLHYTQPNQEVAVEGVLLRSESLSSTSSGEQKQSKLDKTAQSEVRIDLDEFIAKTDLANRELASAVYLKCAALKKDDAAESSRLPRPALPKDLCYWYVSPEKHQAYATFWLYASFLNVAANVALWFIM